MLREPQGMSLISGTMFFLFCFLKHQPQWHILYNPSTGDNRDRQIL